MELKKAKKDIIYAALFVAFGLFMILYAIPTQIATGSVLGAADTGVDSRTLPYIASGAILILGAIQLVSAIINYTKALPNTAADERAFNIQWRDEFRALLVFGIYLVYALLMEPIGFIACSLSLPLITLFILKDRKWKHYLAIAIIAIFLYVLSRYGLGIILP